MPVLDGDEPASGLCPTDMLLISVDDKIILSYRLVMTYLIFSVLNHVSGIMRVCNYVRILATLQRINLII